MLRRRLAISDFKLEQVLRQSRCASEDSEKEARSQRLFLEEMHHRVKNTLAVVTAIVSQTLNAAASVKEGRVAVVDRLQALARVQDLLLRHEAANATLRDVVRDAIEPFDDKRCPKFLIDESAVRIKADAVLPLSLLLNELSTNAIKFGALSIEGGRVSIAIEEGPQRLKMIWTETGLTDVKPPAQGGFGTRLLKHMACQLHGETKLDYCPQGLSFELDVPLEALQ